MHVRVLAKVFQFGLLVVGVHGDIHGTNLGTGIEQGEPVGYIGSPDAHVRTALHTYGYKAFGHVVYASVKLAPAEAQVTV